MAKYTIETRFTASNGMSAPVKKMTGDVKNLSTQVSITQKSVSSQFESMGKVTGNILTGIGVAALAAGVAVGKLALSVSSAGDNVAKTARYLGLTTDALQEFRYIGERSGVAVAEMDTALKKLTVNLSSDTEIVAESLRALGLTARQLKAAGPDEVLNLVADGMSRIQDPSKRARVAFDLFGKSGIKMVNVLAEGRSGMARLADEAHRVGYVMDTELLTNSEIMTDEMLNFQTSLKGIGNIISRDVIPQFNIFLPKITDMAVQIGKSLSAGGELNQTIGNIGKIIQETAPFFGGFVTTLGLIKGVTLGYDAALKIATGAQLIFNAAMAGNPVGLIVVGVSSLIGLLVTLELKWGLISKSIDKAIGLAKMFLGIKDPSRAYASAGYGSTAEEQALIDSIPDASQPTGRKRQEIPISTLSPQAAQMQQSRTQVDVMFRNPPEGTTIRQSGSSAPPVSINTGVVRTAGVRQ